MKKYLLVLFILWTGILSKGFCQQITFENTYSLVGFDLTGMKVLQNTDGSFIILANADSSSNYGGGCLVKTDSLGNVIWSRLYSESSYRVMFRCIKKAENNSYVISGLANVGNVYHQLMMKVDSSGNISWSKCYGSSFSYTNVGMAVEVLSDGNYIMCGRTDDYGAGSEDAYLIKTDTSGNTIWSRTIGTSGYEIGVDIEVASNGNFVLMGGSSGKTFLSEFDNNGNLVWSKDYALEHLLGGTQWRVKKCLDSGFAIVGVWTSDTSNVFWPYMFKTDSAGNIQWCKLFTGPAIVGEFFDVCTTSDSGLVVTWEPEYPCQYCRTGLIKTNGQGNIEWSKNYTLNKYTFPSGAIQTNDNGYAEIGYSYGTLPIAQIALLKTDSNGAAGCYDTTLLVTPINLAVIVDTFGILDTGVTLNFFNPYSTIVAVIKGDDCIVPPSAPLFTSTYNSICPGTCIDFINLSYFATSYQWSFPSATPPTSTAVNPTNICYSNPGSYDVQLIATNANGSDTLLLANYITVYPTPPPQSITQNGDTLFAIAGAGTYQWYFNTTIINGATNYFYIAPQSGDYNVVCTDTNGCEVEAAVFNVVAGLTPAPPKAEEGVTAAPNPVTDKLFLISSSPIEKAEIKIYNLLGEMVLAVSPLSLGEGQGGEADVHALAKGMYRIEVRDGEKTFRSKFVKQ